jgi:DNA-binding NarL/FixJ family response regulator
VNCAGALPYGTLRCILLVSRDGGAKMGVEMAAMDKLRTFVVEDSPMLLEQLCGFLVEGAPVDIVGSADSEQHALAWLRDSANTCDVILIDIYLKAGTGLGVLKQIVDLPCQARQVVVLSNYATPEMRRRCVELGADKVFDKSSEIDELLAWFNELRLPH